MKVLSDVMLDGDQPQNRGSDVHKAMAVRESEQKDAWILQYVILYSIFGYDYII